MTRFDEKERCDLIEFKDLVDKYLEIEWAD